jgi:hypothetical protein
MNMFEIFFIVTLGIGVSAGALVTYILHIHARLEQKYTN